MTEPDTDSDTDKSISPLPPSLLTIEQCCWIAIPLMVIIRLIQGPSVSDDQWYTRAGMWGIAIIGIVVGRLIRQSKESRF